MKSQIMEKNSIQEWFYKKYSRKDDTESSKTFNENLENELTLASVDKLKKQYIEYWDSVYEKRMILLNKALVDRNKFNNLE